MSVKHKDTRRRMTRHKATKQHIVPTWVLLITPVLFIFLGYASEHYKKSRGMDRFLRRPITRVASRIPASNSTMSYASYMRKSLLAVEEDDELEKHDGKTLHLIVSTECSPYQNWQSYLVYYSAMKVKQPGHVTRIVSGCRDEEASKMKIWFDEMSKRFHIHFTPRFSDVFNEKGEVVGDYKYYNKPFGVKHWIEHFELLSFQHRNDFQNEDHIVILIDPDMLLTRPITGDFSNPQETVISKSRQGKKLLGTKVTSGLPFGSPYGLSTKWQRFHLDEIVGMDSPAKGVSHEDAKLYFPVGPPYLATLGDMHKIANKWTEIVPRVHAEYPHLLAEMYAYCIAAAHLNLPHQIIDSLMVSGPGGDREGWSLVDAIPPSETCAFSQSDDHSKYPLPSVLHHCQRYAIGKDWYFSKKKIPADVLECETPLFEEPPGNVATLYDYKKAPNEKKRTKLSPRVANHQAFMVCFLTSLLNEAATFYKKMRAALKRQTSKGLGLGRTYSTRQGRHHHRHQVIRYFSVLSIVLAGQSFKCFCQVEKLQTSWNASNSHLEVSSLRMISTFVAWCVLLSSSSKTPGIMHCICTTKLRLPQFLFVCRASSHREHNMG